MKKSSYFGMALSLFVLSTALASTYYIAQNDWHERFLNINITCNNDQLYHWSSVDKEWTCIKDEHQPFQVIHYAGTDSV